MSNRKSKSELQKTAKLSSANSSRTPEEAREEAAAARCSLVGKSDIRVFVSSTWLDLQPERTAVAKALQRLRETRLVGMEYFGSRDSTPREISLGEVDRCHVYLGIIGERYGSGITEAEYRRADQKRLHCLIYFKDFAGEHQALRAQDSESTSKLKKLAAFKKKLRRNHTISGFKTPDDLAAKVTADIHNGDISKSCGRRGWQKGHPAGVKTKTRRL